MLTLTEHPGSGTTETLYGLTEALAGVLEQIEPSALTGFIAGAHRQVEEPGSGGGGPNPRIGFASIRKSINSFTSMPMPASDLRISLGTRRRGGRNSRIER